MLAFLSFPLPLFFLSLSHSFSFSIANTFPLHRGNLPILLWTHDVPSRRTPFIWGTMLYWLLSYAPLFLTHDIPKYFSLLPNTTWGITNSSSTGNYLQRLHSLTNEGIKEPFSSMGGNSIKSVVLDFTVFTIALCYFILIFFFLLNLLG